EKLLKAQRQVGIELIWYWHGRINPETGEKYGSKYKSFLDRWTLEAFDLAISKKQSFSITDEELATACKEIASRIARNKGEAETVPEKDAVALEMDAENSLERLAVRFVEIWENQDLTRGEKQIRTQRLLERFAALLMEPNNSK